MKHFSLTTLKWIRNGIVWGTMLLGFICWLYMPSEVLIHLESGRRGSKLALLIVLLLPLFAMIPATDKPEFHVQDAYAEQETERAQRNSLISNIALAVLLAAVVLGIMITVLCK